jgi:hypothetical protein
VSGNQLTIAGGNTVILPDSDAQALSISGNVISLTNGGSVTLPTATAPDGSETKVVAGTNVTVTGAGTTANPYVVTAAAAASTVFATPAETVAGTSTTLAVNPADLYARENIAAQTGVSNDVTAIPAPTAGQSPWATNALGEQLHYEPGVGWQIVSKLHGFTLGAYATVPVNTINSALNIVAPRAGRMTVSAYISALMNGAAGAPKTISVFVNKGPIRFGDTAETSTNNALDANASGSFNVLAGDVINITYVNGSAVGNASTLYSYQYES